MKTRIIKTKFWSSSSTLKLSKDARYLSIYLLSCPHIGLTGIFELPDQIILMETGLTSEELQNAKLSLEKQGKMFFYEDWVWVVNHDKHNPYNISPKTAQAYWREAEQIPDDVKQQFQVAATTEKLRDRIAPYVSKNGEYKHRLVAEKVLGRKLASEEVVHHIDRNPANNSIANLAILPHERHVLLHQGKITLEDSSIILLSYYSDSTPKTEYINNKSEIINQNTESRNQNTGDGYKKFLEERKKLRL